MAKRAISAAARRRLVVTSTKASARLELRSVPAEHVRSAQVEKFLASLLPKA